jgi:hypothetical protein
MLMGVTWSKSHEASTGAASSASAASPPLVDVLYVGGAGRSGSTVLAILLGRWPEFVAAGGVNNLWERGLQRNFLCGCGLPFRDCEFWTRVGEEAFGGWDAIDVNAIVRLQRFVTRYRNWPWYLAPEVRPHFFARATQYGVYVSRVYAAIASVSGSRVVIDTSHDVSPAFLLWRTPGVRLRILHLVRDSRGVAFSLSKRVLRPEATATETFMPTYSPAQASFEWTVANLPFELVHSRSLPRLRIRYESLVASPSAEMARIAHFIGVDPSQSQLALLDEGPVEVPENHMISGNPHRLGRSALQVRLDDEWRRAMRPRDRMLVSLLTLPLRAAYGYVGRPAREPRTAADARAA